jgi:hypothetical protein
LLVVVAVVETVTPVVVVAVAAAAVSAINKALLRRLVLERLRLALVDQQVLVAQVAQTVVTVVIQSSVL